MTDSQETSPLTLKQRLCCLLAVTDREAEALLRAGRSGADTSAIARRVGLDREEVERIVGSDSAIETARIDVNRVVQLQLHQVPDLSPDRMRVVLDGRPYFSLQEFEEASRLSNALVKDLFTVPELEFIDKVTGERRRFEPVFGKYIARPKLEFESPQAIEALGFTERPTGFGAPIRVVISSETEAPKNTYELKRALGGLVFPVLRDAEGFERYLVPATIDIWFRQDISPVQVLAVLNELGLRVHVSRETVGYYQAELAYYPADLHVTAATLAKIQEIQERAEIKFAEPTEVGFEDFEPKNERLLPNFESSSSGSRTWNLEAIEIEAAHSITEGSPNVTIVIIDSGIRPDHQDLSGALRPDWTTLDLNFDLEVPEAELSPVDLSIAHGTKVASVAGGRAPVGGSRVRGVAPGCWLLPVKISGSPFGQSYGLRAVAIREAVSYVRGGQRGVINLSWSTNGEHLGVREALFEASDKGFAIVTSAGNYPVGETQVPDKTHYPSQYAFLAGSTPADIQARRKIPGLVSVAAVDVFKKKTTYSYYGAHSVTISAPGGEPGGAGTGVFVANIQTDYAYDAGTSFAAPHVAGLIALLWSAEPALSAQAAIELMCSTATDLDAGNPSFAGMLGTGLINARAALNSLGILAPLPGATATTPTPEDTGAPSVRDERVNINTASIEQLKVLPYIGEWSARVIVEYLAVNGPFASIWDLTLTGAVDRWTVEQIKHLITAGSALSNSMGTSHDVSTVPENSKSEPLNINAATANELAGLLLLGEWSTDVIITYRGTHGPFATIWDLTLTGAVDHWTVEQIKHLITAA